MKTRIYVYTGTGNSLWAARILASKVPQTEILPMPLTPKPWIESPDENVGLVFPVHIWGLPKRVIEFIRVLKADVKKYYFAIAVNGGQVAATLLQMERILAKRGLDLSSGFSLPLPSNYIPWGGPGTPEEQEELFTRAFEKLARIAEKIRSQESAEVEKGPFWQNFLFSGIYQAAFSQIPRMDRNFQADEKCNACTLCRQICPAENIQMKDGKPFWLGKCEQCLACLQWCPQKAIQYGKNTAKFERYHHPKIHLSDMLGLKK